MGRHTGVNIAGLDVIVGKTMNRAGFSLDRHCIDDIEDLYILDEGSHHDAGGASVQHRNIGRDLEPFVQEVDEVNAETFVVQQEVAQAENADFFLLLPDGVGRAGGEPALPLRIGQREGVYFRPLKIEEIRPSLVLMSFHITMYT